MHPEHINHQPERLYLCTESDCPCAGYSAHVEGTECPVCATQGEETDHNARAAKAEPPPPPVERRRIDWTTVRNLRDLLEETSSWQGE